MKNMLTLLTICLSLSSCKDNNIPTSELISNITSNYESVTKSIKSIENLITDCGGICIDKYHERFDIDKYHLPDKSYSDLVIFEKASGELLSKIESYNSLTTTAKINATIESVEKSHSIFFYDVMHSKREWALSYLKENRKIALSFNYQGNVNSDILDAYITPWITFMETGEIRDSYGYLTHTINQSDIEKTYNYASQMYDKIKNSTGGYMDFQTFYSIIDTIAKPPY